MDLSLPIFKLKIVEEWGKKSGYYNYALVIYFKIKILGAEKDFSCLSINISKVLRPTFTISRWQKEKERKGESEKWKNYEIQFLRKGLLQTNLCDSSTSHANVLGGLTAVFPYHLHPYSLSFASPLYEVPREQEG